MQLKTALAIAGSDPSGGAVSGSSDACPPSTCHRSSSSGEVVFGSLPQDRLADTAEFLDQLSTQMVKEGRKFTHFCVTAGVCTPSRASIMTGCYAQRVGMHLNRAVSAGKAGEQENRHKKHR